MSQCVEAVLQNSVHGQLSGNAKLGQALFRSYNSEFHWFVSIEDNGCSSVLATGVSMWHAVLIGEDIRSFLLCGWVGGGGGGGMGKYVSRMHVHASWYSSKVTI